MERVGVAIGIGVGVGVGAGVAVGAGGGATVGTGVAVGAGVVVGSGVGNETTMIEVDARIVPLVDVLLEESRADTPCRPVDAATGTPTEIEKLPVPLVRNGAPDVALSSATVPFMFFGNAEPRTLMVAPAVVDFGNAVSCAEVAAVTLGAKRAAISSASIANASNALASRTRPPDRPRTLELEANGCIVQAPDQRVFRMN